MKYIAIIILFASCGFKTTGRTDVLAYRESDSTRIIGGNYYHFKMRAEKRALKLKTPDVRW